MKKKLLDRTREKIKVKHYSLSTERTYLLWIKQYIFFHDKKHPIDMGGTEIEEFLTYLATKTRLSPTTQIKLLGHRSVETTMIYTHVVKELNRQEVKSPLDFL